MSAIVGRLISPRGRRLFLIHEDTKQRAVENLLALGWSPYFGPGKPDADGWFIPDTDPAVTIHPPIRDEVE